MNRKNLDRRQKIKYKIRKKVNGTADVPRLVVYRSLNQIYGQLVNDVTGKTIFSVGSISKDVNEKIKSEKGKISKSKIVGKIIAEKAKSENIMSVVFDRNGYLYHGRVKAFADGAREGGLKF
jgi:large subunit ribosomal protein L18